MSSSLSSSEVYENALKSVLPYFIILTEEGFTSCNQKYTIVVNKIAWYKVRLFIHEDHLEKRKLTEYHWSQHISKEEALKVVKYLHERMSKVPLLEFKPFRKRKEGEDVSSNQNPMSFNMKYYFDQVKLSDDCKTNPDKYLNIGDHVYITRKCGIYHHDAIYLGNKRVVHIFGDMSQKTNVKAKEDDWTNFVGLNDEGDVSWFGTLYVVVYRLKIRSQKEIVSEALKLASELYGEGKYHLLDNNCQHFASFCCTGVEISMGANSLSDALWQSLTALTGKKPYGSAIEKYFESPFDKEP